MKTPPDPAATTELDPHDAADWLAGEDPPLLLDCREPSEFDICRINGASLIPLTFLAQQAPPRIGTADRPVIIYCHHGVRSLRATNWLRAEGFTHCFSLRGGIERWAREIDPTIARY